MRRVVITVILLLLLILGVVFGCWSKKEQVKSQGLYCNNQLRQIDGAKEQAAQVLGVSDRSIIAEDQIAPYIKNGMPKCPSGGTYTIKLLGQDPTCSLAPEDPYSPLHQLP